MTTLDACISLNNAGFIVNFLGVIVAAFSLDDPAEQETGGALKRLFSYVRRPRLFAAGLSLVAVGMLIVVVGARSSGDCLSLRGLLFSAPPVGIRPACLALRQAISATSELSAHMTVWGITILLTALAILAVVVAGARRAGRIGGLIRIMTGSLLAPPLIAGLLVFGSKLYWLSFQTPPPELQAGAAGSFHLEDYEGEGKALNAALKRSLPVGTPRSYVDSLLSDTTRTVKGSTVTYLYRTRSLTTCLFSAEVPPIAWRIEASYSPQGSLTAMIARPMQETASP